MFLSVSSDKFLLKYLVNGHLIGTMIQLDCQRIVEPDLLCRGNTTDWMHKCHEPVANNLVEHAN